MDSENDNDSSGEFHLDITQLDYLDGEEECDDNQTNFILDLKNQVENGKLHPRDLYLAMLIAQARHNLDNTTVETLSEIVNLSHGKLFY